MNSDDIYEGLSENEREDEENENYRMPARPKRAPAGWVRRVRCDECRQNLGFMGLNMAVPIGTPVLCGPCCGKEDVRSRFVPEKDGCQGSLNSVLCGKKPVEFDPVAKKPLCASHRESVANVAAIFDLAYQAEAVERFWDREREIRGWQNVFVSRKPVPALRVVDTDGGEVFEGAPPETEGFLFWIDEEPSANWAHPCRYVLSLKSGSVVVARREWPPGAEIYDKLVKIERPWPNGGGKEQLQPKDYYAARLLERSGDIAAGSDVTVVEHLVSRHGEKACFVEVGPWDKHGAPLSVATVEARKLRFVSGAAPKPT